MSDLPSPFAAVVFNDEDGADDMMAGFARELAEQGVLARGLVQHNTPNEGGGHMHMDLIDVKTGEKVRISQDLGPGAGSCHLHAGAMAAASEVLRQALAEKPALVFVNRFGDQEINGRGFSAEMLQIMSEGIPLLTMVATKNQEYWKQFTGDSSVLLPPKADAVRRWFAEIRAARPTLTGRTVLADTIDVVKDLLGPSLDDIVVERAVVGQFFTGVKLSTGTAGASYTPSKPPITTANCRSLPKAIELAGFLKGRPVRDCLDDIWEDRAGCRALGVAVLNALAETCWRRRPHPDWIVETGIDALTAMNVGPEEHVVLVGAFASYIARMKASNQPFSVLELDPVTFLPAEMPYFRPAKLAPEIVPKADVLVITGSTVVNDTIDELVALAAPGTRSAVVGPSVPLLPDVLGARGIDLLATIRVTDPDRFLDILAEGGGTQSRYHGSADLVVLRRRP